MADIAQSYVKKRAEEMVSVDPVNSKEQEDARKYETMTDKHAGFNRLSVQSKKYFRKMRKQCKELYRCQNFSKVRRLIYASFNLTHQEPTAATLKTKLSEYEQCLIGLMYLESGMSQQKIAGIFGYLDHSTISRVCALWVPKWGRLGRHLSILPFIDAFTIDEMESEKFVALDLRKVAYLKDGKDFLSDTSRTDRVLNNAQQSSKVHHSAVRILTWGLPCGLSYEHTDGFLGRVGEKLLVELWTKYSRLILSIGYLGIGDKVFFFYCWILLEFDKKKGNNIHNFCCN